MAIDTRDRRFSMLQFGHRGIVEVLPNPDAVSFSDADRQMLLALYHGISISVAGQPTMRRWGGSIWPPLGVMRWGRGW